MLDERQLSTELYKFVKDGRERRNSGKPTPYAGNTVAHMLSCVGWVQEDLRLALMRKDESYCFGQALYDTERAP